MFRVYSPAYGVDLDSISASSRYKTRNLGHKPAGIKYNIPVTYIIFIIGVTTNDIEISSGSVTTWANTQFELRRIDCHPLIPFIIDR